MPIQFKDLPNGERLYSYVDPDGTNIHIASAKIYDWCIKNEKTLEIQLVPVDPLMAKLYINQNTINRERLRELAMRHSMREDLKPCIFGIDKPNKVNGRPDVFHIDGHHRYVLAAALAQPFIPAWILTRAQWEPYQVMGVPDITQEELNRIPPMGSVKPIILVRDGK